MRQVERSIFDLRRGLPLLLRSSAGNTLIMPLEGLTDDALAALTRDAGDMPRLVISRHRLTALGIDIEEPAARLPISHQDTARIVVDRACARSPQHMPAHSTVEPTDAGDEGALALMRRGLLIPAAVTASVTSEQAAALETRVETGELLAIDIQQIADYEASAPAFLKRISSASVPVPEAENSRFVLFRESDGLREHIAIVIGEPADWADAVPVRLHSACLTGDLFGSLRCDCGEQLRASVARIADCGGGVLLYLAQEGRGIGLANKLRAYSLQDDGLDTVDADQVLGFGQDEREYHVALEMLSQLEIRRIELLTNNPAKIEAMSQGGITVVQRSGIYGRLTAQNQRYLTAKATRAGHWLDQVLGSTRDDALLEHERGE